MFYDQKSLFFGWEDPAELVSSLMVQRVAVLTTMTTRFEWEPRPRLGPLALRRKNFSSLAGQQWQRLHLRLHVNCRSPAIAGPFAVELFSCLFIHWPRPEVRRAEGSLKRISNLVTWIFIAFPRLILWLFHYDFRGIKTVADTVFDYVIIIFVRGERGGKEVLVCLGLVLISGISPSTLPARSSGRVE
jgi:hypothetical protein